MIVIVMVTSLTMMITITMDDYEGNGECDESIVDYCNNVDNDCDDDNDGVGDSDCYHDDDNNLDDDDGDDKEDEDVDDNASDNEDEDYYKNTN